MFANRFTVLVDACSLVPVLNRNLLLSLAAAEFFRIRWSETILGEVERAIMRLGIERGIPDARDRARRSCEQMRTAFPEATVMDFSGTGAGMGRLPDPGDAHVIEAAAKTRADLIITENLRDFPARVLRPLNLEAKGSDDFIADTVQLDPGRAVEAIRRMRERYKRPELTAVELVRKMEGAGLLQTVDSLRGYVASL